jgi:hypothetical protein
VCAWWVPDPLQLEEDFFVVLVDKTAFATPARQAEEYKIIYPLEDFFDRHELE